MIKISWLSFFNAIQTLQDCSLLLSFLRLGGVLSHLKKAYPGKLHSLDIPTYCKMILRMFRSSQYCIDIIQCHGLWVTWEWEPDLCVYTCHAVIIIWERSCSQIKVKSSQFQFWGSKESFVFLLLIVSALYVLSPKAIWNMYVSNMFPLHFIMGHSKLLLNPNFRSLTFMASHLTILNFIRRDFKLLNSVVKTFIICLSLLIDILFSCQMPSKHQLTEGSLVTRTNNLWLAKIAISNPHWLKCWMASSCCITSLCTSSYRRYVLRSFLNSIKLGAESRIKTAEILTRLSSLATFGAFETFLRVLGRYAYCTILSEERRLLNRPSQMSTLTFISNLYFPFFLCYIFNFLLVNWMLFTWIWE